MMRKIVMAFVAVCTACAGMVATSVAPATAAPSFCNVNWGSGDKDIDLAAPKSAKRSITNIRSGRHRCFDRLVVDMEPLAGGVYVGYTSLRRVGNSNVRGGDQLMISIDSAGNRAAGAAYQPSNPDEAVNVTGYSTFRQVAWLGTEQTPQTHEGMSEVLLGVRARLPFRVFTIGDGRVVIDVAHRWS